MERNTLTIIINALSFSGHVEDVLFYSCGMGFSSAKWSPSVILSDIQQLPTSFNGYGYWSVNY